MRKLSGVIVGSTVLVHHPGSWWGRIMVDGREARTDARVFEWRRFAWLVGATALLCACGPPNEVRAFSVQPPLVCPGETVQVQWDVKGRAELRASRGASDWDLGQVPSTGGRTVAPTVTTTFTITALDAKLALGNSSGTKTVQVPALTGSERGVPTTCDATSRVCTGSFTLSTGTNKVHVATISAPTLVKAGMATPAAVTVTHPGWQAQIAPGGQAAAGVPADGTWTIASTLPAGEATTPPPQLRVTLAFDCSP